jgi:NADPH:quinone reductase-like Zn-dependent oxidoreductase
MAHGVLTTDPEWPAQVGDPVQVLVDTLGAALFEPSLALLAPRGRMIVLGTMTGSRAPEVDLSLVLRKRLEIIGTAMRVRGLDERAALVDQFSAEVLPWFAAGRLAPVVDRVLAMRDVAKAHAAMQSNATFGKVVLAW